LLILYRNCYTPSISLCYDNGRNTGVPERTCAAVSSAAPELAKTIRKDAVAIQKKTAACGNDSILPYTVLSIDGSGTRYTLAQGVKLIMDAADIPAIAATADAFEDDSIKFRESGMNDCLTKPLDQDRLVSMLVKYSK